MTKLEKQTLTEQVVILDDHAFVDCVLEKCTVYYAGGPCLLVRTQIRNSQFNTIGAANNTLQVLATLGMLKAPAGFQPGPAMPN